MLSHPLYLYQFQGYLQASYELNTLLYWYIFIDIFKERKKSRVMFQYILYNHILEEVPSAKYLGITISNDMSWNKHINQTSSKANRKLGFLRRNIKTRDQALKEKACNTTVRPPVEYCSTVWDPYYMTQADTIEKVQRHAARWVTGRFRNASHVSDLLQHLDWCDLNQRRVDSRLCMLYKIKHGLVDIPIGKFLKFQTYMQEPKYYEINFDDMSNTTNLQHKIWYVSYHNFNINMFQYKILVEYEFSNLIRANTGTNVLWIHIHDTYVTHNCKYISCIEWF